MMQQPQKYVALYCRTSTRHQANGLQTQKRILKKYCEYHNIENYKIFSDFNYSGKLRSRPELDKLMQDVRDEKVSQIITPNLSRISRSLKQLLELVEEFQYYQIEFTSISENFSVNNSYGRLIIAVLGAVSQMEREMISEKTKQGLENCRAKGIQLGRKRQIDHDKIIALSQEGNLSIRAIARLQGCSPSSVSRVLKKHNS